MEDKKYRVTFGGWFQRTTLHLSEIHSFLQDGTSKLELNKTKLTNLFKHLEIKKVSREVGLFEYVTAETESGITIRYYEDGLYIFEKKSNDIEKTRQELNGYYDECFSPAITYLFSLGAPTPKVLADIKISHVAVVSYIDPDAANIEIDQEKYSQLYSKISAGPISVYKTINYIFIVTEKELENTRDLIETQIFFREFKDQLARYLNIHRSIWEEISDIKESGKIKGAELEPMRLKLDGYQKTISLINNRINQMATYAATRRTIAQKNGVEDDLSTLFQFRFEVLFDTLEYIKHIWAMTNDYLFQAIGIVTDVKNMNLNNGITSVRSLMVVGIVSMVIGTATMTQYPKVNNVGIIYISLLLVIAIILDYVIKLYYRYRNYKLNFSERRKEFK